MYLGETVGWVISKTRTDFSSPSPEVMFATDVTTSDRNKTMSPSISYTTGVA